MKYWFPVIFYLKSRRNEVLVSGHCTTWNDLVSPVTTLVVVPVVLTIWQGESKSDGSIFVIIYYSTVLQYRYYDTGMLGVGWMSQISCLPHRAARRVTSTGTVRD
jgi:hypothetical protein